MAYDLWCAVFVRGFLGVFWEVDEMLSFFLNNDSRVFVSSVVMKEQPLHSECVARQIVAGSRSCILT